MQCTLVSAVLSYRLHERVCFRFFVCFFFFSGFFFFLRITKENVKYFFWVTITVWVREHRSSKIADFQNADHRRSEILFFQECMSETADILPELGEARRSTVFSNDYQPTLNPKLPSYSSQDKRLLLEEILATPVKPENIFQLTSSSIHFFIFFFFPKNFFQGILHFKSSAVC